MLLNTNPAVAPRGSCPTRLMISPSANTEPGLDQNHETNPMESTISFTKSLGPNPNSNPRKQEGICMDGTHRHNLIPLMRPYRPQAHAYAQTSTFGSHSNQALTRIGSTTLWIVGLGLGSTTGWIVALGLDSTTWWIVGLGLGSTTWWIVGWPGNEHLFSTPN